MKHIAILIACAMLSACKDEPKVQTWKMAPESEWTTGNEIPLAYSNYVYSNYVHLKPTNAVMEMIVFGMRLTNEPGLKAHPYRRYESSGMVLVRTTWFPSVDSMVQYQASRLLSDGIELSELSGSKAVQEIAHIHGVQKVHFDRYEMHLYRSEAVPWADIMPKVVAALSSFTVKTNSP